MKRVLINLIYWFLPVILLVYGIALYLMWFTNGLRGEAVYQLNAQWGKFGLTLFAAVLGLITLLSVIAKWGHVWT